LTFIVLLLSVDAAERAASGKEPTLGRVGKPDQRGAHENQGSVDTTSGAAERNTSARSRVHRYVDVSEQTFAADVVARSHERPVVVDFWADWCGPCHALTPVLEREIAARNGAIELAKVDVDADPELATEYRVSGIPAVKAFRDGRVVAEFTGVRSPQAVADFLDSLTQPSAAERAIEEARAENRWPEVLATWDAGDRERALELLLDEVERAEDPDRRDEIRRFMVSLFDALGQDDPVTTRYRRRLAAALY
jgi:thioredoxin